MSELKAWAFYVLYALDLLLNAILDGSPHETLSSRCYRLNHIPAYAFLERVINAVARPFDGPDHCRQSYDMIVSGGYLPWGFYGKAKQRALAIDAEFMFERTILTGG